MATTLIGLINYIIFFCDSFLFKFFSSYYSPLLDIIQTESTRSITEPVLPSKISLLAHRTFHHLCLFDWYLHGLCLDEFCHLIPPLVKVEGHPITLLPSTATWTNVVLCRRSQGVKSCAHLYFSPFTSLRLR